MISLLSEVFLLCVLADLGLNEADFERLNSLLLVGGWMFEWLPGWMTFGLAPGCVPIFKGAYNRGRASLYVSVCANNLPTLC